MEAIIAIIGIVIVVGIVMGAIKTFQRNWIAALLLIIFLFPIWVIWALIEVFTGEIAKEVAQPVSATQNVTVTLVNQNDRINSRIARESDDDMINVIDAQVLDEQRREISTPTSETKECPSCAEIIRKNAKVCRFCSRDV